MRRFRDALDRRYLKIATYGGCTALVVLAVGLILLNSAGFWKVLLDVVGAILRPLCLGLLFSYLMSPLAKFIEGHLPWRSKALRRNVSVAITVVLVIAAVVLLMFATLSAIVQQIQEVRLEDLQYVYTELTTRYQDFLNMAAEQLSKAGFSADALASHAASILSDAPKALSTLVFSIIFTVYFLVDGENISAYWKHAFEVTVGDKAKAVLRRMARDAQQVFSGYLRGQFLDALLVGIEASVVLGLAGVPYGVMIGILTGVGNLIPYVTGFVGYSTLIISCLAAGDMNKLIVGAICLAVVLVIDSNVVNPRLLGSTIKVHPLLVVVSLIAGGTIGGVLGMLVAVPTGAFIKLQFDHYLERRERERAAEGGLAEGSPVREAEGEVQGEEDGTAVHSKAVEACELEVPDGEGA